MLLFTLWFLNKSSSYPHAITMENESHSHSRMGGSECHMIPTSRHSLLDQMGTATWPAWIRIKTQTNAPRAYRLRNREKNVSVPIMAEMEATERGYAEETMRKWGPGTRSSGQLSKALHFLVKGRERCALITSQILRTWAKLGTEFSDLPLWTLFCYFL